MYWGGAEFACNEGGRQGEIDRNDKSLPSQGRERFWVAHGLSRPPGSAPVRKAACGLSAAPSMGAASFSPGLFLRLVLTRTRDSLWLVAIEMPKLDVVFWAFIANKQADGFHKREIGWRVLRNLEEWLCGRGWCRWIDPMRAQTYNLRCSDSPLAPCWWVPYRKSKAMVVPCVSRGSSNDSTQGSRCRSDCRAEVAGQ